MSVKKEMDTLKKAMIDDPEYAYSWHANIAMMCHDAIKEELNKKSVIDAHSVGNDAASRFMKICFDVETSQNMLTG